MRAVVITADSEDRDFFSFVLRRMGLSVAVRSDLGQIALLLSDQPVDLIFLLQDQQMNLRDSVEEVRTVTQAPLIVLAEAPTEEQQCAWLDVGVDLVLKRPLSPRLLTRYVKMLLRRAGAVPATILPVIQAGDLVLDPTTRNIQIGPNNEQHLSPLEFRLLYLLMTNRGQVIPTDVIVERVWGYSGTGNRELVRGLIRRLRRRLEVVTRQGRSIQNVPGVGYRFVDNEPG